MFLSRRHCARSLNGPFLGPVQIINMSNTKAQGKLECGRVGVMEESEKEARREASEEVSGEFQTLVHAQDLDSLKKLQLLIVGRLQDSNAVLSHFNEYSEHCYTGVSNDFSRNTRLLKSMKTDLDYIFQKLRSMKSKILATYPDAFQDDSKSEVLDQRPDLEIP